MGSDTYADIGRNIGVLVQEKQAAYGDSFGKSGAVMAILYPDGIPPEKLNDALTVVRVLDKLFRIATDRDALGESPWRDIAGYALLSVKRQKAREPDDAIAKATPWCGAHNFRSCIKSRPHLGEPHLLSDGGTCRSEPGDWEVSR